MVVDSDMSAMSVQGVLGLGVDASAGFPVVADEGECLLDVGLTCVCGGFGEFVDQFFDASACAYAKYSLSGM